MSLKNQEALQALEVRLKTILPEEYQESYNDVQPVSMGSAGLKYGDDGKVEWDDMWRSFCDLAMAGGPPHKGTLLEPGAPADMEAQSARSLEVVTELCRGIRLVTDFAANPSTTPGWISVDCVRQTTAEWLVRAIVMENISAHCEATILDLPAGPGYRMEKEIKNVITAIAKTTHYWFGHMWPAQHREIGTLFATMAAKSPLIQPALPGHGFSADQHQALSGKMGTAIHQATGLRPSDLHYAGWLGVECPDVRTAIWMMRSLVASNVLSRREGTVLFMPVNPVTDPTGEIVIRSFVQVHGLAIARQIA